MSHGDEIDSTRAFQIALAVKAHIVSLAARSVDLSNVVIADFFDPHQPCSPLNLCRHLTLGCLPHLACLKRVAVKLRYPVMTSRGDLIRHRPCSPRCAKHDPYSYSPLGAPWLSSLKAAQAIERGCGDPFAMSYPKEALIVESYWFIVSGPSV